MRRRYLQIHHNRDLFERTWNCRPHGLGPDRELNYEPRYADTPKTDIQKDTLLIEFVQDNLTPRIIHRVSVREEAEKVLHANHQGVEVTNGAVY